MSQKDYEKRLFLGLDSRPSEFHFTGIVRDLGKPTGQCTCGHSIRHEYVVADLKGTVKILGSECIGNYHFLNHIREEIEKEKERLALLEKQKEDETLNSLLEERLRLIKIAREIKSDYDYERKLTPYPIYEIAWKGNLKAVLRLKTAKGKIKKLEGIIANYKKVLGVK